MRAVKERKMPVEKEKAIESKVKGDFGEEREKRGDFGEERETRDNAGEERRGDEKREKRN